MEQREQRRDVKQEAEKLIRSETEKLKETKLNLIRD